jgi:hypothetical protein
MVRFTACSDESLFGVAVGLGLATIAIFNAQKASDDEEATR